MPAKTQARKSAAPKKVTVPKKGGSVPKGADLKIEGEVRSRRQWSANDHRDIIVTWAKVGFKLPLKSMVPHLMRGYAINEKDAIKLATEIEINLKDLVASNAAGIIEKVFKVHSIEAADVSDVEVVD